MLKSQTSKEQKKSRRKANQDKCVWLKLSAQSAIIVCVSQPYPIFKSHLACSSRGIPTKFLTKKRRGKAVRGNPKGNHFLARWLGYCRAKVAVGC